MNTSKNTEKERVKRRTNQARRRTKENDLNEYQVLPNTGVLTAFVISMAQAVMLKKAKDLYQQIRELITKLTTGTRKPGSATFSFNLARILHFQVKKYLNRNLKES
jgi:hypothetical protein